MIEGADPLELPCVAKAPVLYIRVFAMRRTGGAEIGFSGTEK